MLKTRFRGVFPVVLLALSALVEPCRASDPADLSYSGFPPASAGPPGVAVLQGPTVHAGSAPLAACLDVGGAEFGVPTLYVADLFDGLTFLYDATTLDLLGSISGPSGVAATTGLTTDGTQLFWVADNMLYASALDGSSLAAVGPLALPAGGAVCGDICRDALGQLWAVDIANDQISAHSAADGAHLGPLFSHPGGVGAFGNGIAFRSDCELLEIPYGVTSSGQVTSIAVASNTGTIFDSLEVGGLGVFVNGVDAATPSPGFGVYSLFVVENATNALYEVEGIDPCPTPQADCHASPGVGYRLPFENYPLTEVTATPGLPISSIFPTTNSLLSVAGADSPVLSIDCDVDISHTWIGDLDVSLEDVSSGIVVQLHDSAGIASDDIVATFADEARAYGAPFASGDSMQPSGGALSVPGPGAMADFVGVDVDGQWRLAVTDNFAGEDGTLNAWSVAIQSPLPIPDGDPLGGALPIEGGASLLDVVADLDVEVEIEHPAAEQLLIELVSPDGMIVVVLAQPGGPPRNGLVARYDDPVGFNDGFGDTAPAGPGSLADFDGLPVSGSWELRITDAIPGESGVVRRAEILICPADCPEPVALSCSSDCVTGTVSLSWSNPQSYDGIEILRDGVFIATLPGTESSYDDVVAAGIHDYEVIGSCAGAGSAAATCSVVHAPYSGERNLILAGEGPSGAVDSVTALSEALIAAGEEVLVIETLDYPCLDQLPSDGVLWLCLGTYFANYVLTTSDGQILADHVESGRSVFIEGADVWGFDPPTPFADHDGVENETSNDGDDSFASMLGASHADLDLAGLMASYTQDQPDTSDYTDRLLPTGTTGGVPLDVPGLGAGIIWTEELQGYATGILYAPVGPAGRVIAQSWEFGGYGGDATVLAAAYRDALTPELVEPLFQRGNVNGLGLTDLADAIFILNYQFIPMSPAPDCLDAADLNDDGAVGLADAIFLLNYLFVPGSSVPPAPGPGPACGPDPTPDALPCTTQPGC